MIGSIIRRAMLRMTGARAFRSLATHPAIGGRAASRFVAGGTLDDAIAAAERLGDEGLAAMLNHLGESAERDDQAIAAAGAYIAAIERIGATSGLDCQVSIKLTQLGLDRSEGLCLSQVERVLAAAGREGIMVMIDMEDHRYVDRTLAIFRDVRSRHDLVGVCLQSALRRTPSDLLTLPEGSTIRLVKGAYLEPADVAFQKRREVDGAWAALFTTLLSRGHRVHAATHDERLVEGAIRIAEERVVPRSHVEFQMLYGIRRDLQRRLAAEGRPVRVYVPYGAEWYPYLTRRLLERPANVWFFLSNVMRSRR